MDRLAPFTARAVDVVPTQPFTNITCAFEEEELDFWQAEIASRAQPAARRARFVFMVALNAYTGPCKFCNS